MRRAATLAVLLAAVASADPTRPRLSSGGSSSSGTVTPPATGAGVDTCTGDGCRIGPAGIATDGGFIATGGTNFAVVGNDVGVVFGNAQKLVSDSLSIYLTNTGPATRPIGCAGAGTCDLGLVGRNFGNVYSTVYRIGNAGTIYANGGVPTTPVACTSPTITHGMTASFQADVGTSCTGVSTFAFTVPSGATNGTRCTADNITASTTRVVRQTAGWTGTTVTMTNFAIITDVPADFTDGTDLVIECHSR